ncbi:MAG: hypothetical protein HKN67_08855 [Saprospiraceae bacterium]|nr:hypothetical protein [Saprospiraceae bacterium]
MKVLVTMFMLSVMSLSTMAQEYKFRVMMTTGTNEYQMKGNSEWEGLKTGKQLNTGDKIKIGEKGYVVLIHNNGSFVELKTPGLQQIDQIGVDKDEDLSSKYLGYVVSKMAPDEQEKNRKKYASVTGATERGFNAIDLFMKSSSPVYNTDVVIRWSDMGSAKRYKVSFGDLFDEIIHETESDNNYLSVNLADEKFTSHQLISVKVSVIDDEQISSEKYSIQRIQKDEFGKYKTELDELLSVLEKESPMSHLIMAEFYEGHKLLLDAATSYEEAIKYSGGIDYFKQAYVQFLMRNGWSEVL